MFPFVAQYLSYPGHECLRCSAKGIVGCPDPMGEYGFLWLCLNCRYFVPYVGDGVPAPDNPNFEAVDTTNPMHCYHLVAAQRRVQNQVTVRPDERRQFWIYETQPDGLRGRVHTYAPVPRQWAPLTHMTQFAVEQATKLELPGAACTVQAE